MSQEVHFQISYDGPALDSHEMDVRELAPALLAMSDLLEEANNVINGSKAKVSVKVKGSFKTGSFPVDFALHQSILDLISALNSPGVTGALNLAGLLGLACVGVKALKGLFQVLLWLKNRPIDKVVKLENDQVKIYTQQESLIVHIDLLKLLTNINIRRSIEKIVLPLKREGIDNFSVKQKEEKIININKEEVDYLNAPIPEEQLIEDDTTETSLQLVNVAFQESNKWRFTDGTTSFYAMVKDQTFINRVQNDAESFSRNDILFVKLRRIKYETEVGLKTEYEVLEVKSHKKAGQQMKLPLDESFME